MTDELADMMANAHPDSILGHMREMKRLADEMGKMKAPYPKQHKGFFAPLQAEDEHGA